MYGCNLVLKMMINYADWTAFFSTTLPIHQRGEVIWHFLPVRNTRLAIICNPLSRYRAVAINQTYYTFTAWKLVKKKQAHGNQWKHSTNSHQHVERNFMFYLYCRVKATDCKESYFYLVLTSCKYWAKLSWPLALATSSGRGVRPL